MPINFPNSPSIGATYDYEGIHYIYNGIGWVNKSIFGISAGTNISFTNYNGTGPLIISAIDTTGITSAVTSFNGKTGAVQGVSSFAGLTGTVGSGITTNGILYFDGSDVQGSALLTFNGSDIVLDTSGHFDGNILGRSEVYIKADEAINEGDPVYVTGSVGASERLTVAKADSAISAKMPAAGIAAQSLASNGEGVMIINGWVRNYDTTGLTANQILFVASGGGLTATRPTSAGVLVQNIARVGRPNHANGSIIVTGASRANDVPNTIRVYQYIEMPDGFTFNTVVSSFNGNTGAVQGISAAVAGSGISVSGATGSVTITNTGVLSFNGNTGAIQGVSSINGATGAITSVAFTNAAQTFSALQSFSSGISASSGITFGNNLTIKTGSGDLTIGSNSGPLNTLVIGNASLASNNTIANSIIIGKNAMSSSGVNSADSFAIGLGALNSNDATSNFGIGVAAGYSTTLGGENFFIGNNAGYDCVEGSGNVAIGPAVLQNINNGTENTGIGYSCLFSSVDTNFNTAVGSASLQNTSSGSENTAIGYASLATNLTGAGNVALGYNAGLYRGTASLSRTTGTGGIYIGYQARASANAMTDEIVIGRNAVGLGSNTAVIGATAQSSATIYGVMNLPGGLSASGGITFNSNIQINNKAILGSAALGAATPGCIEFDGNVVYAGTTAGRGVVSTQQISVMTAATKSLLNATGDQNIFDTPQDVITLAANTTYQIEGYILLSTGTTTLRHLSLRFTQGIVANPPTIHFATIGVPTTSGGAVRAQDTAFFNTTTGGVITQTTFNTNSYNVFIRGLIKTVDSVTITPQIAFSAAPGVTNTVNFGTYISFIPIGNGSMASVGPWA